MFSDFSPHSAHPWPGPVMGAYKCSSRTPPKLQSLLRLTSTLFSGQVDRSRRFINHRYRKGENHNSNI
ncbi:hypothetical protein QVD17_32802 [Tagetes erecta]|uniref:Uncharacterized protein n=1 Tax=Tagetes erecta TaxID=13708 RepID=A0AAD8JYS0_TARER|nr:hypothetical protein QVD17_32802 [Tagetes erecta]